MFYCSHSRNFLTSQIAGRFKQVFGDDMALWHSQLSKSQRAKTWRDINDGTCKIVIGARSAIFSPVKNLGLIIVDEEHDSSYKQDSPSLVIMLEMLLL